MSAESLPKYMFLHEDSEQMKDKRIQTATFYEETQGKVQKKYKKRVNNTFPLKKPTHSEGIFNLEYSNKYGVMLMATDNEVLIVKNDQLEKHLLSGKQEVGDLPKISFSGSIFLSPNQELLAICTDSLVQIISMATLPNINKVPAANQANCNRALWVDDKHLLLWNFMDKAYLMKVDDGTVLQVEGVSECTGASIVGDSLLIMEKLNVSIFKLGETKASAKVDLSYNDHESFLYDYSFIVEIFRVNVHGSTTNLNSRLKLPLNEEDILGLVMVYYDEEDEEPNQRYITYFKGNLLEGELNIRGNEMFFSSKEDKAIYFDSEDKIPFSVKIIYSGYYITVMIQRSEVVYIIDPFQSFDKINIYETSGKTELKDPEGNFFRGMGIIKHLFAFQKYIPEDAKTPLLEKIVNEYHGEFMTLYFASQETNLNIAFPPSVIAITGDKFYRRYAVSSLEGIDKDKDEDIVAGMEKIKRSPHLMEITGKISSQSQPSSSPFLLPSSQGPFATQGDKKVVSEDKKEEQKPGNIFGSGPSIFSSTPVSAFPSTNSNPFAKGASSKPNLFGSGSTVDNVTSMFPKQPPTSAANEKQQQPKVQASSLFSAKPSQPPSLFGLPKEVDKTSIPATKADKQSTGQNLKGLSLFGSSQPTLGSSLFSASSEAKPSIFAALQPKDTMKQQGDKEKGDVKKTSNDIAKNSVQTVKEAEKPIASQKKQPDNAFGGLFNKSGDQPSIFGQLQPKESQRLAFKIEPKSEPTPEGGSSELKAVATTAEPQKPVVKQQQKVKEVPLSHKQTVLIQKALRQRLKNIHKEQVILEETQEVTQSKFQKCIQKSQILKSKLRDFKANRQDKDKLTLNTVQSFCEERLKDLQNPQSFILGAPLSSLLIKAEAAKQAYKRYEWMFDSTLKKKLTKKQVEDALDKFQVDINRAFFFVNAISPHKNARSVSALSEERKNMINKRQLDNVQELLDSKIQELQAEAQILSNLFDEYQRQKSRNLQKVNTSQISSRSQRRKYEFSSFMLQDQIEQKYERKLLKTRQSAKNVRKQNQPIVIKMSEVSQKPKFSLPPFEVLPSQQASSQANPLARTGKLPTSASFSQVNQAKGMSAQPKPKEKVSIPMVNTKLPKLQEKDAVSEAFEKSDAQQELIAPMIATRQISKIEPQEPKKKTNQAGNSVFGHNKMGIAANKNNQQQQIIAATKVQKPEEKTSKKEQKKETKGQNKLIPPSTAGKIQPLKTTNQSLFGASTASTSLFGNTLNLSSAQNISQKNQEKPKEKPAEQPKQELQKTANSLLGSGSSLFNFGGPPAKQEEVAPKVDSSRQPPEKKKEDISVPLSNLNVDDKKEPQVPKVLASNFTLGTAIQDKKGIGLFGTVENKKSETQNKGPFLNNQNQGGLSGSLLKPADKPAGISMFSMAQKGTNSLFGLSQQTETPQKKEEEKDAPKKSDETVTAAQSSVPTSSQAPVTALSKDSTEQIRVPASISAPQDGVSKQTGQNKPTTIASDDKQKASTAVNQPKSTPLNNLFATLPEKKDNQNKQNSLFGGLLGQPHANLPSHSIGMQPAFGAANKFLANNQNSQPQSSGFDPTAMSFGGGSTQRSFASINNQQGASTSQSIFKPNSGNTLGGSLFGAGSSGNNLPATGQPLFANAQSNNFFSSGNAQQQPAMPQNAPQSSLFGQSSSGMFGQGNILGQNSTGLFGQNPGANPMGQGSSGGSANFLLGMGQSSMPNPPPGMNPSLMAPRK